MIDKRDPEAVQQTRDAHWRFDQLHLQYIRSDGQRGIGEATYLRSLFILGYLPKDAQVELNHLKATAASERNNERSR